LGWVGDPLRHGQMQHRQHLTHTPKLSTNSSQPSFIPKGAYQSAIISEVQFFSEIMTQLTWLITGCSSGFGEELILSILARGDRAIATTRGSTDRIKHLKDAGAATMSLDVTDSQPELDAKVQEALKIYDGIDVLINNAGYIEAGLIEDIRSVIRLP
jgi:hypothetical protein